MATYDDLGLYFRLKTLDWVSYDHLKIHPLMQVDGMWDIAAKNLKQIDKLKTASEKLNAILECSKIVSKSYTLISPDDKPVTADDIYPIVGYVLIKAAPRRLVSNMKYFCLNVVLLRCLRIKTNSYLSTAISSLSSNLLFSIVRRWIIILWEWIYWILAAMCMINKLNTAFISS